MAQTTIRTVFAFPSPGCWTKVQYLALLGSTTVDDGYKEFNMSQINRRGALALSLAACGWVWMQPAWADEYDETIALFKKSDETGRFFKDAYGYAVFPKILKGAVGVGGARGTGRVYEKGKNIGDVTMTQLSIGFQLGGEGFSQVIFFENKAALDKFTSGSFEFGAEASAVALTASAGAKAGSTGAGAGASVTKEKAKTVASYINGMAVFTIVRGGLMYEVSLAGQKFSFKKKS
jgi:lipid-binding SYLF domain-containing protein